MCTYIVCFNYLRSIYILCLKLFDILFLILYARPRPDPDARQEDLRSELPEAHAPPPVPETEEIRAEREQLAALGMISAGAVRAREDYNDLATGVPAGSIEVFLHDVLNQRAVCKYHPACNCWLHARVDATGSDLRADLLAWLSLGRESEANQHKESAFELKRRYGMKPKPLA